MPHSLPLSLFILMFATTLSCSSHLYQSNFSILFYLTQCLCLSMTLVFWWFPSFFFFFCYILLFFFLWNKLSTLLPLFLILPPFCHSIFLILLSVYFCLSDYLCMALSVILLFFYYLSIHSLSLHNCNSLLVFDVAPLPISLQYYLAILIFDYFLLITLSLSLSFTHRLSVFFFHYFCLTLSLYYSLFR